jgi:hypothetical protein
MPESGITTDVWWLVVVVLWYLYIEMKYTAFPVAFLWYYGYDESPEIVVIGEVNCTGFCGSREE